jgi:translocation and assembly module TamA
MKWGWRHLLRALAVTVGLGISTGLAAQTTPAALSLDIEAPENIKSYLSRHLELLRYNALDDLDTTEVDKLLQSADTQARELLGTLGYFSPQLQWQRETANAQVLHPVRVHITPGEPSLVSQVQISFSGELAGAAFESTREKLTKSWWLPAGRPFTQEAWNEAKNQLLRTVGAQDFPQAKWQETRADIHPEQHSAALTLVLDSGPRVFLGSLQIEGTEHYDAQMVQRLARLPEGQAYKQNSLIEAQQRLISSGYYDSVLLALAETGDPKAWPVKVQLREAARQKIVLGVGVKSDNGMHLSAEHVHHLVPGLHWRASTKLELDQKLQSLGTELLAPPNARLWRWNLSAKAAHEVLSTYETHSQRWRAGQAQLGEKIDRNIYAQYDSASSTLSGDDTKASLSANFAWTWRGFDSLPFPSRGWGFGVELGAGRTLGDNAVPYARWLGKTLAIAPLPNSQWGRIALRGQAGGISTQDASAIPNTQLFITGGQNSVRGYAPGSIGVANADGTISPGRYMAVGSAEWQVPIRMNKRLTDWEGTLFVDAGAVANDPRDLQAQVGVGMGARWRSPVGPLQIDLAYGEATKAWRLHLNVGFVF